MKASGEFEIGDRALYRSNFDRAQPQRCTITGIDEKALAVIGEQLGEIVSHAMGDRGGVYGAIAGAGLGVGGYLMHSLRQTGISTVNDLVGEAMLHPNVARELLACVAPDGTLGPLAQRPLAAAMQGVLAANAARQTAGMQQQ